MFIFPDRENTEFAKKYVTGGKNVFTQGIYLQHREFFEVLKIEGCTRIVVGYSYNLLALKHILSWRTIQ